LNERAVRPALGRDRPRLLNGEALVIGSVKRKLVTFAIGLHLFFIISVASHLHNWLAKKPGLRIIAGLEDYYSAITFANRNFGFFAPEVTADWNVHLTMMDASGNTRPYVFRMPNREMEVRMYSMIGHFGETETSSDLFARSWALKAINENPDIREVHVEVTQNAIPTMKEYRNGRRIEPKFLYRTTFNLP
jgi:hypothetical protein